MPGQLRERPIHETLAAARDAAERAGVTRLADLTGMAPYAVPVFQAVRPMGRLFSVAQGKGLTPAAAKVSALLEAVETDLAERLAPEGEAVPLSALDPSAVALWHGLPRDGRGLRLQPDIPRHWTGGRNLLSGEAVPIPWDLLSLDSTRALPPDVQPSSLGLATGNSEAEALAGAVAELIEHDLDAAFDLLGPVGMRMRELDLDSVDAPAARALLRRLRARGAGIRVWSQGQEVGMPAFRCAITDGALRSHAPPAGGNGCHPDREVALVRAVLEAVQSRSTMIAGAREDLAPADYLNGRERTERLIMGTLSLGAGPLRWADVPHHVVRSSAGALDALLACAGALTELPVVAFIHRRPHPDLAVVHCLAPGLRDGGRGGQAIRVSLPRPIGAPAAGERKGRPVLFVGPTLPAAEIPPGIDARPPAICGDLAALLRDPPPAVGLIDGCFEIAPTVWHKEILDLLALGVPVIGGASLGAIRAAELAPFGMTGIGAIFAAYRDGGLARDDAVMLCHGPAELGYPALTLSLVDAEAALAAIDLPPPVRRQLQRIARTTDFRERTWEQVLAAYARRTGAAAPVDIATLERASDRKRRDARDLVAALGRAVRAEPRPRPPLTGYYAALLASRCPAPC